MVDLYADMFELAPVSLWIEDYSALKQLFERWRGQGVVDLRAHLRARPDLLAECARRLRLLRVNQRTLDLFGARDLQHLIDNLHLVLRDDMLGAFVEELGQLWDGRLRLSTQTVNYTLSGERLNLLLKASVMPGHETHWERVLIALEDVTERHRAEEYARSLFEHSPVSLWAMDFSAVRALLDDARQAHGDSAVLRAELTSPPFVARCLQAVQVLDANQHTLSMFNAHDKATLLANLGNVLRDDMGLAFGELLLGLGEGRLQHQQEATAQRLDGQPVFVYLQFSVLPGHEARWDRALMSLTDITARKRAEADLAHVSSHDALTGLRNRSFFNAELARLDRLSTAPATLLVIDLDGLKATNDQLGHAAGDELLRRAGRVIGALTPAAGTAARIGGDEFALLLPGGSEDDAVRIAQALRDALVQENLANQVQVQVQAPVPVAPSLSFSIGMATRQAGEALGATLHRADAQMYENKRRHYAARGTDRRAT